AGRENLQWLIATAPIESHAGIKTRYHGDYHLGQVLISGSDFVIIDFEGEPARSFDERRQKGPALRDVAGMLRSFNYVRWSALRNVTAHAGEVDRLAPAAQAWEKAARSTFLSGYTVAMAEHAAGASVDLDLLALFELEKAMYELRYELNNRTEWVQVPLQGILALLEARAAR
ncbi:MAG: alpha-amylase, partial [Betaproteobacteria bacterium]